VVILIDSSIFIGWTRRGFNPLDMLRRQLHAKVAERFSLERAAQALTDLYQSLLPSSSAQSGSGQPHSKT